MKRLVYLALVLTILITSFAGCNKKNAVVKLKPERLSLLSGNSEKLEDVKEAILICKNDKFNLFYSSSGITVTDVNNTETVWSTYVDERIFPEYSTSSQTWKDYMQSIASITYDAKTDTKGNFNTEYSNSKYNKVEVLKYSNGISIKVDFAKSSISVLLEITLGESGVNVRIPADKIKENGNFYLYSVEVFPFLNSANESSDGYLFYPDGCGALSYFSQTHKKSKYARTLTLDIYGTEESKNLFETENNAVATLPVYGIKNGNIGILAAITQGDEDAQINVNPALELSTLKLNRASFSFIFRRKYSIDLSQLGKSSSSEGPKKAIKLKTELLNYDRVASFFLLKGEDANYSGMANTYREYLIENKILDGSTKYNNNGLYLRFFMGAAEKGGSGNGIVKTTDFSDVETILADYNKSGVDNITAVLRGWQSGGWGDNISTYQPESAFGGKKGLKKLNSFIGDNDALNMLLEVDNLKAYTGMGFFTKGKDTITDASGSPVTDINKFAFVFNPNKTQHNLKMTLNNLKKYPNLNVLNNGLGKLIYSDLNDSKSYERYEVKQIFEDLLKKSGPESGVTRGNLYSLKYSDFISESPQDTSSSLIEDKKIPWYQMLIHGSAAYSTKTGNSSYNLEYQKLKWIEYGASPYFELTKEEPSLLRDTNYTQLFSSKNSEWKQRITDIYKEFNERLSKVSDGFIIKHEVYENGIVAVSYDNGSTILLNYSNEAVMTSDKIVPSMDYIIVKE